MIEAITDKNFQEKTSEGLTLTDFWAPWCGPCRMQSPIIEEMAAEGDGSVEYFTLDVDENPETAAKFGIMSIPTLLIQKDGEVVEKLIGLNPKENIEEVLARHK